MKRAPKSRVSQLLADISHGNREALGDLVPLIYDELRQVARARMAREAPGHTLQPTALVHEVYLRLLGDENVAWENRAHFFSAAAESMRRILIERARRYSRKRHGGGQRRVPLDRIDPAEEAHQEDLLALDEALARLEEKDPQLSQVVKLRYFAGLTVSETARALGSSPRTVNRLWTMARAWLNQEMSRSKGAI